MANRIVLVSLILIVWYVLRTCDLISSGTRIFFLLGFFLILMATHTLWLLIAQRIELRKQKLFLLNHEPINETNKAAWHPAIDILISVKNESSVISKTVENFLNLNYLNYNLWVIDDCSTDNTLAILKELAKSRPHLKIVERETGSYPGKSAALNDALAKCNAEVVAVFDADASVDKDFFYGVLPYLETDKVGAVQVQKKIYRHQTSWLAQCQASEYALDTYFQMGRDLISGVVELRGNGQIIKRSALIDVGGWNDKSITDDLDLSMRFLINNWDIVFCPDPYVLEEAVTNLPGLIRQRTRWAEGSIRRYLDYIFPLNSISRLSLIERIDLLAFTVFFIVPALIGLELFLEIFRFYTGVPTHGMLLLIMAAIVLVIAQFNIVIAMQFYQPELSLFTAIWRSFVVNAYIFAHWVPCIVKAITKILFGKKSSKWHPTKHVGVSTIP